MCQFLSPRQRYILCKRFGHHLICLLAGVEHGELVSLAEKHFGNVSLTHEFEIPEFKKCRFTGSEVITSKFFMFVYVPII